MENTIEVTTPKTTATASVKKTAPKKATTRKVAAKKTTPVAKKTVKVETNIDTTKAVNAVAEAANEVQATSKEIKNAVVKSATNLNKKVAETAKDVNKKVTSSVNKLNKEVKETAAGITSSTTKLANDMIDSLNVNERLENVKDVVMNPNKHALKAADNMIDSVEKNTIKWQKVADKAVTTGLKLAVMQEELVFSSLEAVKTHVGTTAMRIKQLFGSDKKTTEKRSIDKKVEVNVTAKKVKA